MDWNTPSAEDVKALLIVAHPDDETIFCGGTMLTYPAWKWTIVCMTHAESSPRHRHFWNAMNRFEELGVNIDNHFMLGQEDHPNRKLTQEEEATWRSALKSCNLSSDLVFTHNTLGEFGHEHHKYLNTLVHELFPNPWEFICPGAKNVNPQPGKKSMKEVPLSDDVLRKKLEVFRDCYPSEQYLWRDLNDVMEYEFRNGPEIFTSD